MRQALIGTTVIFFIIFHGVNYLPWHRATHIKQDILSDIVNQHKTFESDDLAYVANLPDNYFGAYIFRNGFEESVENIVQDKTVFIHAGTKKIWQLKSEGPYYYLCDKHFLNGTNLYVWNEKTKQIDDRSHLLENKNTTSSLSYDIIEHPDATLATFPNTLWDHSPDIFTIYFPKNADIKTILTTCPLWLISKNN